MINPRYANYQQTAILVDAGDGTGRVIYIDREPELSAVVAGKYGAVGPYVPHVPVAPDLAHIKTMKLARIRAARHAVEFGGMMHNGVMYDSDATARAKCSETARVFDLMPEMVVEGWKASDGPDGLGVYVTMTKALLDALTLAGAVRDKACFDWEREMASEVAAAETVGEVEAVSEAMS